METKDKVLENIEHIFSEYEENKKMFNDDTLVELFSIYKSLDSFIVSLGFIYND